MIDYHAHVAALRVVQDSLGAVAPASPFEGEWQEMSAALNAEPGAALLGTLLDHLLERSEGAKPEQDQLEEAAALYGKAIKVLESLAPLRHEFEELVDSPASVTVEKFDDLTEKLEALVPDLVAIHGQLDGFTSRMEPPFRHVAHHAVAVDLGPDGWLWRDVILSRRTDAFIRELRRASDGSQSCEALAFGALAGYAANRAGSSYIVQTVGGPRRSHPIRDRMARYSVGAWLRTNEPDLCLPLDELRARITMGGPDGAGLPAGLQDQILRAIAAAYPAGAPALPPDLNQGYTNLLRHLELLESFPSIPPAEDIPLALWIRIMKDPQAMYFMNNPQDVQGPPGFEPPLPDVTADPENHRPGTSSEEGGCGGLGLLLLAITIIGIIIYVLIKAKDDPDNPPNEENPEVLRARLATFFSSNEALKLVLRLYQVQDGLLGAANRGLDYLQKIGMIYPEEKNLTEDRYRQFTNIERPPVRVIHRPNPDPDTGFADFPLSPIELPVDFHPQFGLGATPSAFIHGQPPSAPGAGALGIEAWTRHLEDPNADSASHNLDADRGPNDPCWRVLSGTSITANPVAISTLAYTDVD